MARKVKAKPSTQDDSAALAQVVSVVGLLGLRAQNSGAKLAVGFIDSDERLAAEIDFAGLDRRARAIGAWIAARGARGQRVMLLLPTSVAYIEAFFGCLYGAAIPVPVFPPHKKRFKAARLDNILRDCGAEVVLTTSADLAATRDWLVAAGSDARAHSLDEIDDLLATGWRDPLVRGDDVAFLQYTSGSSNAPKGVMVSHANLLHNLRLMRQRWSLDAESTIVCWLPIFHDLGIVGNNLLGIYLGASQYLMLAQDFVKRPGAWLRAISGYRAVVAMAPNFAFRLCETRVTAEEKNALDLSTWRAAVSAGEPIVPEMSDGFVTAFASCGFRPEAMKPSMGMAETTLFISSNDPSKCAIARPFDAQALRQLTARVEEGGDRPTRRVMSCGPVLDELIVRIVDPVDGRTLPPGGVGELWISGASVALGYWNKPEATEAAFCAYAADTGEGPFLRTGDLGFLYDGELHVCGRLKNMIIIRGQNYVPTDIEVAVESCSPLLRPDFGVAFAVSVAGEERLIIVYEVEAVAGAPLDIDVIASQVSATVADTFELQLYGLVLVERGTLSKTTSGKVTRAKTHTELLEHRLTIVAQWLHPIVRARLAQPDAEALADSVGEVLPDMVDWVGWLCEAVAGLIGIPVAEVDPGSPFASHGLSSMGAVELAGMLEQRIGRSLSSNIAYDYPSVHALAAHLACDSDEVVQKVDVEEGTTAGQAKDDAIAIVGLACRLPGARNLGEFWRNLAEGVDSIAESSDARRDLGCDPTVQPNGAKLDARWGGFVEGIDQFDPEFFGIAAQEAAVMDPQQRLLLEVTWEAFESAGITMESLAGTATGVFVGLSNNDYGKLDFADEAVDSPYDGTGNAFSIAANRMSYLWDLHGPSIAVDTACSSSLVAVHLACRSVLAGESTMAIAAGVNLLLAPELTVTFSKAGMMSPRGRCRSFDDGADGYVRSEGCASVLLKSLSAALRDGDRIHAVIRGTAVNQDGRSNGLTAPNGPSQERVIRAALDCAGVDAEAIDYVETHGSGTPLGDPIEAGALANVFAGRERRLLIGSVKTNVGHLEAAAGIAGLLKVVLALTHEHIPASLHFETPNQSIPWERIPLAVCSEGYRWPRGNTMRFAGVASFGFGGTNAHVIVEEAPSSVVAAQMTDASTEHLLVLSAKSPAALQALAIAHDGALASLDAGDVGAFCVAAAKGRTVLRHRLAVVGESAARLRDRLSATVNGQPAPLSAHGVVHHAPRVAWMFAGQGGSYAGAAVALYQAFPLFRRRLDECARWHEDAGNPALLSGLLGGDTESMKRGATAQPAQFAFQLALSELWRAAGVAPEVVIGHSIGEYAAACTAGMLSARDALALLAARGRLMDALEEGGGMLAIAAATDVLVPHLSAVPDVNIAALNGPMQTVCAGPRASLQRLADRLGRAGMRCVELPVTHAFHSPLMRPMLAEFREVADSIAHAPATLPFVSCVTGERIARGERIDAGYWSHHIEAAVNFEAGLRAALVKPLTHVLEIGPRPTLTAFGQAISNDDDVTWLQQPGETHSAVAMFLGAVGRLFADGARIDWSALYSASPHYAFHLPNYPFQRKRYWNRKSRTSTAMSDSSISGRAGDGAGAIQVNHTNSGAVDRRLADMIGTSLGVVPETLDRGSSFIEMGMDSISLIGVVRNIEREFGLRIEIRQLFESLFNLELLVDYVAQHATAGPAPTPSIAVTAVATQALHVAPASMVTATPAMTASPTSPSLVPSLVDTAAMPAVGGLQGILGQQLETMARLMQSQLMLLGNSPVTADKTPSTTVSNALPPRMRSSTAAPAIPMWKVAETSAAKLTAPQQQHLDALVERYCARTRGSKEYAQRHRSHLADNRVVAGFRALTKEMHYPLVGAAAHGARMRDVDNNEYIDVTMGFGVNLFGHNPPFVSDAISARLAQGMQLGPQADLAGEVAALICELTGNERAAFVSTGTEAVMIACRLARAATGRDTIVIFNGAYHGQHDSTIAVTDPDDPTFQGIPGVPGVTAHAVANTVMLNYADESALQYIAANADRLAAVLVEPVQSRQPELQPREFLHALRALTEQHGIALIFDEMITGFRCHPGGAQALFGVRADLVTYGKIVGGGLPIGVVSGSRRFMDVVDGGDWQYGDDSYPRVETTFVSGTHSKHPLTMAAARAVLQHLKEQGPRLQERLNARTAAFAAELNAYFAEEGLPIRVPHFSSIFRIAFAGNSNLLYYHMLEKGVFLWEGRVYALSTAHTDADLAHIVAAMKASVEELRAGGFLPPGKNPTASTAPPKAISQRAIAASVVPATRKMSSDSVPRTRKVDFSLSFFGRYDREYRADKYDLLFASARYADQHGFTALWVPERHFHPFGGFSPNPSVIAAALARETSRIQLRAGSVVIPLHHPIRIAEEWALVDNLSQGRVGIAAASGWHPEDFVLAPESYRDNREITFRSIDTVQRLWRGESVEAVSGTGKTFNPTIYPMPKQPSLPMWITVVKNPETYAEAGRRGLGILTNMMGQTIEELRANVALYRQARSDAGFDPDSGIVTVLVHTFVTADAAAAQRTAAAPFRAYLSTMAGLLDSLAKNFGKEANFNDLSADDRDYLLDATYERYVQNTALIGSPDTCAPIVESLMAAGANELACFVDFGVDSQQVLESLPFLQELKSRFDTQPAVHAPSVMSAPVLEIAVTEEDL